MINSNNPLSNLELFEELNDQVSEKISGGVDIDAIFKDLESSIILDSGLEGEIGKKIKEFYPDGLADTAALSCVSTDNKQLKCSVSSNGETNDFSVPIKSK